jgi:tetratricopeptide (TPR) repeat protein
VINFRFKPARGLPGLALATVALTAGAQAADVAPDFEQQSKEFRERIAALEAIDPLQPQTLSARVDYARLLHQASVVDCLPHLQTAEQVLAPVLNAGAGATLAWPDGPGDAMSLLQTIQNTQGQCAEDEAGSRAAFESAILTGQRAVGLLRDNWDFEEMAIAQFNIAFARRELGDLDGALRDLELVLEWDQEYGFHEELESDYATLLRWRADGEEPDPDEVDRFVSSFNLTKARFEFAWQPHRSHWSTEAYRANLKNGVFGEERTRYESRVDVRRDGADWVLATTLDALPTFQVTGAAATANANEKLQGMISGLTAALPEVVVAPDGSFKGLRNLEAHRANLLQEVKRMIAEATPPGGKTQSPAEVEQTLNAILNPELLTTLAAAQWDIAVGAWIGGEFDHGDWYSLTFDEPLPGFSDKPVSKTMNFKVSRWLPCGPGRTPDCVEVLVKITPDTASLSQAIADFVGRLIPAASRSEMEKAMLAVAYQFDMRYRIVTEPDTLRPWSVEERKYIYASSIDGGKRMAQARQDRTVETGSYPD